MGMGRSAHAQRDSRQIGERALQQAQVRSRVAGRGITSLATFLGTACGSMDADPDVHPVAEALHDEVASGRTPAVQYRFFSADSVLFSYDEGLADIARGRTVGPGTTYNGFSVTKTVTALAVLQLAEQDKLNLDHPAAGYLPEFPYSWEITIRQLLSHSAGIANPIPLRWTHLLEEHDSFDEQAFFRDVFAMHPRIRTKPNARFAYSNLGYVLLGQIIENVSGKPFEAYIVDHILRPIGAAADDLGFSLDESNHARGYHDRRSASYLALGFLMDRQKFMGEAAGRWRAFRPYHLNGSSYGGLIGTADGFTRYLQTLLDPHCELLSEESRHSLFGENILSSGRASGMALSWFKGELNGHTYFAHAGGGGGYYAEIRIYPDLGRGSVIFFNRSGMSDQRFLDRVDRHMIASPPEAAIQRQDGAEPGPHGSGLATAAGLRGATARRRASRWSPHRPSR
jgi:D-alanyl-D-alanine carboxypeptidase